MLLFSALVIRLLVVLIIGFWFIMNVFFTVLRVESGTLLYNQFDPLLSHLSGRIPLFDFQ